VTIAARGIDCKAMSHILSIKVIPNYLMCLVGQR